MAAMHADALADVLDAMGVGPGRVTTLKDVPFENGSWLVEPQGGPPFVMRRYHDRATREELAYEHAVLLHLAQLGWVVPHPLGDLLEHDGRWYCPTRFVPGEAVRDEDPDQRRRRGRDLALLHVALRELGDKVGQRPGWRPQHTGTTVHVDIDWDACLHRFAQVSTRLADWAARAGDETQALLLAIGASELGVTLVHGDFAQWNVHYESGRLAGVVDFGLAHLDSRPYELAIARTWRSPETIESYRSELASSGWPLTDLEEAAIDPINRAFRVDMVAWQLDHGGRTGGYNLTMIERQLSMTGTSPP
jgi:Ser/Thr protein kinase RdoA (MazF antagonist)